MAFDGNGTFVRLFNWVSDKVNNINITASRVDSEDSGFAAGLTLCVTRDGQGKMAADFLPSADNTLKLGSASFRWSQLNGVIVFSANNNVTVNSPLTGIALTVNGINGQNTVAMQGGATAGQSFGLAIAAGTNSSDRPLQIKDTTNTTNYFLIRGDGLAQAVDQGGTLQDVGWRDAPQNLANANYGLVLSDRGKSITHSSGAPHTWTIPANGTVVFPIGTTILDRKSVV